jgi:hypothetical protein
MEATIQPWIKRGITTINNVMEWWKDYKLTKIFYKEFKLYMYHINDNSLYYYPGWLYNCYHSLYQQVVWQDPVLWLYSIWFYLERNWQIILYLIFCKVGNERMVAKYSVLREEFTMTNQIVVSLDKELFKERDYAQFRICITKPNIIY